MFIAIHADAAPEFSGEATGASVFALSLHGASSEAARWIAEKENYSELGGIDLDNIPDEDNMLRSVLIDLSQTATISDSLILGRSVLHQLAELSPLHHDVVEQAPFMVLKSPDIPSILVETGFITTPYEEQHLQDPIYQQALAQAMLIGIKNYFNHFAPPGTWLASNHDKSESVG
jgi:N-acetylmuramoyl-L-alanine amidase